MLIYFQTLSYLIIMYSYSTKKNTQMYIFFIRFVHPFSTKPQISFILIFGSKHSSGNILDFKILIYSTYKS